MHGIRRSSRRVLKDTLQIPTNPIAFILYVFWLCVAGWLPSMLEQQRWLGISAKSIVLAVMGGLVLLHFIWNWKQRGSSIVTFRVSRGDPIGASGLILLVGPYNPFCDSLPEPECRKLAVAIANGDVTAEVFSAINIEESNLKPQIKAVEYHHSQGHLSHVWLIFGRRGETEETVHTANLLRRYIEFKFPRVTVMTSDRKGREYVASSVDYEEVWRIARSIYKESRIPDEHILADVTGGQKTMSVALAMACVDPKRKVQYMDGERDGRGEPIAKGSMTPVVMDIQPEILSDE